MSHSFKVSIVIPIYNVSSYIERCLLSAFGQTYDNIEYILVNDCTTDDSMEIVRKVISNINLNLDIKIIEHSFNKGLSEARNTGLQYTTGDYIFFLDSDDDLNKDCIQKMVEKVVLYKPDFVIGEINVLGDENMSRVNYLSISADYIVGNQNIAKLYAKQRWYMMAWNKLISKKVIMKNQLLFSPGIYFEDELWSFKLALCANSMCVCHDITYNYYIREGSITTGCITKKHIDSIFRVIGGCTQLMTEYNSYKLLPRLRTLCLGAMYKIAKSKNPINTKIALMKSMKNLTVNRVWLDIPCSFKDLKKMIFLNIPFRLSLFLLGA